jgi:glycosyltransferase involved in cell wall biosynthesis
MGMTCPEPRPGNRVRGRAWLAGRGIDQGDFVFLTVSDALSGVHRKNPIGVISAFRDAFRSDECVRLVIKTHNKKFAVGAREKEIWAAIDELVGEDERIILIDETVTQDEQLSLVASSDCFVSLHRSEGFGLDLLYAMRCGVPVIATRYSGNLDYCDDATALLVGGEDRYLQQSDYAFVQPGHKWVDPSHHQAVGAMREAVHNVKKRSVMTEAAKREVERRFSESILGERMGTRLKQILHDR